MFDDIDNDKSKYQKNQRINKLIPSLIANDASKAIEFYKKVFDAEETSRLMFEGKIAHAELNIQGTTIMISDEIYGSRAKSAKTIGDTPVSFYVYVDNVDKIFVKAVKNGANITYEAQDQFYGDRMGEFIDPFGFKWSIATHIKNVGENEMIKGLNNIMEKSEHKKFGGSVVAFKKYMTNRKTYYDLCCIVV
jgi:PhnB protein